MANHYVPIKQILQLIIWAGLGFTLQSCNTSPTKPEETKTARLEGRILEKRDSTPIERALVRTSPFNKSTETNTSGRYSLFIELPDTAARMITLTISKSGFVSDSITAVVIQNNRITTLPDMKLSRIGGGDTLGTSGEATNIVIVNVETSNIFVAGSGGNETSDITFEVRDDNGTPIDLQHQVKVNFRISGGPNGGEALTPESVLTDALGRVATTVSSGTKAGALQIIATIQGKSISSAPVPIAIHGWLPDAAHFSVVPERVNFAGYNIFGLENKITAFVGDKYSNPVPPGTAVYFETSGGLIEGSAVTDELGRATAVLLSAGPQPQGITGYPTPFNERGFALIKAQTVDDKRQEITTSTVVLFSGRTQVSVTPATFSIPPLKSEIFDYTVSDQNKNPLVAGTTINVSADNGTLSGVTNITLEDTQSRFFTQFKFVLTNSEPDSVSNKDATVTIKVTSQNGNVTTFVKGQMLPMK